MTDPDEWFFDCDFFSFHLAQKEFVMFLQDFHPDTPEYIKELFKDCVKFRRSTRATFKNVS